MQRFVGISSATLDADMQFRLVSVMAGNSNTVCNPAVSYGAFVVYDGSSTMPLTPVVYYGLSVGMEGRARFVFNYSKIILKNFFRGDMIPESAKPLTTGTLRNVPSPIVTPSYLLELEKRKK